jgi:hypothetical protein
MAIVPDTKDWTWVLRKPCQECGMEAGAVRLPDVAPRVRAGIPRWRDVLARPDAARRPDDSTWSPLEYACHVRDVCHLFHERLVLMLDHDDPAFANWDQDVTAVEKRYDQQDPAVVADELADEAESIAARFESVRPDQADRTGRRSDGSVFTVTTFAQYFLHDVVHHEHDVGALP